MLSDASANVMPADTPWWAWLAGVLIVSIPSTLAAVFAFHAKGQAASANVQASQANDAVNHRHDPNQPRIFDMVAETRHQVMELNEWRGKWDNLPAGISDDNGLVATFAKLEGQVDGVARTVATEIGAVRTDLAQVRNELRAHVKWEETVKYPESQAAPSPEQGGS